MARKTVAKEGRERRVNICRLRQSSKAAGSALALLPALSAYVRKMESIIAVSTTAEGPWPDTSAITKAQPLSMVLSSSQASDQIS